VTANLPDAALGAPQKWLTPAIPCNRPVMRDLPRADSEHQAGFARALAARTPGEGKVPTASVRDMVIPSSRVTICPCRAPGCAVAHPGREGGVLRDSHFVERSDVPVIMGRGASRHRPAPLCREMTAAWPNKVSTPRAPGSILGERVSGAVVIRIVRAG
jgi:hypothetical protein